MQEKARILKSRWYYSRFLINFSIRKKWHILCKSKWFLSAQTRPTDAVSPKKNPIKIWPTYAVPPTTTLYPRSTYDLWRAWSSPTIFQPVEKTYPAHHDLSQPDQLSLYFRQTYALPDQGPLFADPSISPERKRAGMIGSLVWTGLIVSTLHSKSVYYTQALMSITTDYKTLKHFILKGKRNTYFEFLNVGFISGTLFFLISAIYTH